MEFTYEAAKVALVTLLFCFALDFVTYKIEGRAPIFDSIIALLSWISRGLGFSRKHIENSSETSHKTSFHPGFDPCEYCRYCGCTSTRTFVGWHPDGVYLGKAAEAVTCPGCGKVSIINHDFIENIEAMKDLDKLWVVFLNLFREAVVPMLNEEYKCQMLFEYGFLNSQDPSNSPDIKAFVESMVAEAYHMEYDEMPIERFNKVCKGKIHEFSTDVVMGFGNFQGGMYKDAKKATEE